MLKCNKTTDYLRKAGSYKNISLPSKLGNDTSIRKIDSPTSLLYSYEFNARGRERNLSGQQSFLPCTKNPLLPSQRPIRVAYLPASGTPHLEACSSNQSAPPWSYATIGDRRVKFRIVTSRFLQNQCPFPKRVRHNTTLPPPTSLTITASSPSEAKMHKLI